MNTLGMTNHEVYRITILVGTTVSSPKQAFACIARARKLPLANRGGHEGYLAALDALETEFRAKIAEKKLGSAGLTKSRVWNAFQSVARQFQVKEGLRTLGDAMLRELGPGPGAKLR